ncbi:hypothetical protein M2347_004179 [Chryseobacterium sp. H1D6B]|uniref:hypothetical protein n=1 Tax=Chryseobacterium sp. H1D6B TaxID=2940588 RepID=UPI0015CE85D8|nr:hypothetical protein [Chryseobacterium sp. H1D6B]MDH6254452.1 hypothetical protein [Chryseobacterium sp. H1D6B]
MKFKILILVLFISIKGYSQFIPLNKYDTRKNKGTDNIFIYKIKGKYESDNHTYLSSGKTKIFENKTDDILVMTLYNKRYLFIGYYPNTQQQRMMAIPYEIREP